MDQDFVKYLNTEREISRFKIESLKKVLHRGDSSTRRLLAIEEEFVNIPFESITSSLSDLLSAIKIFRDSRNTFYNLYPLNLKNQISSIEYIFVTKNKLKEKIKDLDSEILNLKIKPAKDRARVLLILLCIFLYLEKSKEEIDINKITVSELDLIKEIEKKYTNDIFVFYNQIIKNTNDYNFLSNKCKKVISEIKPLVNISKNDGSDFLFINPQKIRGRPVFGFYLNAKHSGREILRPYYMKLYDEDGTNISKLFSLNPKVSLINGEYYKFLPLISLDEIKENIILLEKFEILMKKIFHLKLSGKNSLKIDAEKSLILVPSSRTEDEGLKSALIESSAIFSNILKSII